MKICSLLLAKGNSSFINKNIYPTLGRPLMAYPMLAAKNVDLLIGDPSKAKSKLGWVLEYELESLVKDMMESDVKLMKKNQYLKKGGYITKNLLNKNK